MPALAEKKPNGIEVPEVALALVHPQRDTSLTLAGAPTEVLEEARKAAVALTSVIESKPKKVQFNGKTYLQFEDWQTLGRFYGVTSIGRSTKYVEFGDGDSKVRGFEAQADALLVHGNQVISSAEAMCLNDERNWKDKPLFQLKSMAQTRACAKALRNVLAWVVVLAGYAPTPAEEMDVASRMDDLAEHIEWISNAKDMDELRSLYAQAYKMALTMKDKGAMEALNAAKDVRKKQLQ